MMVSKTKLKLIQATIDCLMEQGMEGNSVRKIATQAGVSTGLINYHYPTVNDLVADAYQHLALTFLDAAVKKCEARELSPRQQLNIFIAEIFADAVMQRRVLRAWVVFWGLIDSSEEMQKAHLQSTRSFTLYLQALFEGVDKYSPLKMTPRMAAIGLSSMIDGLWLEWCLQSDAFSRDDCIQLCEHWLDSV
jgi:AcrR family transcriptional regulator